MYGEINLEIKIPYVIKNHFFTKIEYYGPTPSSMKDDGVSDHVGRSIETKYIIYTPEVYFRNRAIWQPQPCGKNFCIDDVNYKSIFDVDLYKELFFRTWASGMYEHVSENFSPNNWKKLLIFLYGSCCLIGIDKNNFLKFYDFKKDSGKMYRYDYRYDNRNAVKYIYGYTSKRGNFLTIEEKIIDFSISYGQDYGTLWLMDQSGGLWCCKLDDEIMKLNGIVKLTDLFELIYEF